ncbi:MAG: hypothetical protein IPK19_35625 [Chloroflexi bacterium]|nr:hypothetical protein [Chloroflexota bacterium]
MRYLIAVLVIFLMPSAQQPMSQQTSVQPPAHELVFEHQPGPDMPTLQELAGGLTSDDEVLARVVEYYEQNHERLAILWREDHPARLAGIFAMYISHISLPYGETTFPASIVEFIQQEFAHCGTYVLPQSRIATALGLTYRTIEFVAEHAWVEVWVDDHWELFDATTNTWINRTGLYLLARAPREYRYFYTPLLDINRPDARSHMALGYDMQRLRTRMPLMGISYFPPGEQIVTDAFGPEAGETP